MSWPIDGYHFGNCIYLTMQCRNQLFDADFRTVSELF